MLLTPVQEQKPMIFIFLFLFFPLFGVWREGKLTPLCLSLPFSLQDEKIQDSSETKALFT